MNYTLAGHSPFELRQCVDACRDVGGAPACLTPEVLLLNFTMPMWLGLHRSTPNDDYTVLTGRLHGADTARSSEFTECIDGSTPNFSLPVTARPLLDSGFGGCAALWEGEVSELACSYYRDTGGFAETRCLCASPAAVPAAELAWLDEWKVADLAYRRRWIPISVGVTLAIFAVPWLVYAIVKILQCVIRQSAAKEMDAKTLRLRECRARATRLRRRVKMLLSGTATLLACAFFWTGPTTLLITGKFGLLTPLLWPGELNWLLMPPAIALVLLCIFPTDATSIRVTCVTAFVCFCLCVLLGLSSTWTAIAGRDSSGYATGGWAATTIVWLGSSVCISPTLVCSCCDCSCGRFWRPMTPRESLRRLWACMRAFFVGTAIPMIIVPAVSSIVRDNMPQSEVGRMLTGIEFGLLGLLLRPRVRARIHRWLSSLGGASATREQEAAAVAELVGSRDADKLLTEAASRFKALRVDLLHEDDFASNMAVAEGRKPLHERAEGLALGECEAFLSHSWRDAAAPKYFAVNAWAADFYNKHEHHPRIWLDKACIDQANIEQSLACLPIYLAGCSKLLIVAGGTYTSRLWCLMEIFTFVRFNGSPDDITLHTLEESVGASLLRFDASKAQCFHAADRHRLLAVVESAFGDTHGFSRVVREIFAKKTTPPEKVRV